MSLPEIIYFKKTTAPPPPWKLNCVPLTRSLKILTPTLLLLYIRTDNNGDHYKQSRKRTVITPFKEKARFPANTKHLYNIYTMLDQRQRRWVAVL